MKSIIPFLMFDGTAEEAVNFYVSTFGDAKIIHTAYYGNEVPEHEWKAMHIVFTIKNQVYMALSSYEDHKFGFTPSISLYVNCDDEAELDRLYKTMVEGGKELMALGSYGFSTKYGWINDKFGVSRQLNLE